MSPEPLTKRERQRLARQRYRARHPEREKAYAEKRKASGRSAEATRRYREKLAARGVKPPTPAKPPRITISKSDPETKARRFSELRERLLKEKLKHAHV